MLLGLTIWLSACEEQEITNSPASEISQEPISEINIDELQEQSTNRNASNTIDFTIGYNQQVLLISRRGNIRESLLIGFTGIQDSRCPINARCITPGAAEVELSFTNVFDSNNLPMCIGACNVLDRPVDNEAMQRPEDEIVFELANTNYALVLKNVTPYLEAGVPTVTSEYRLVMQIKAL